MKIRKTPSGSWAEAPLVRKCLAAPHALSKKSLFFFLSLFLLAAASAGAEGPAARLDQLAFMAGSWGGPSDGAEVEEVWLPPKGGLMLGLGRTVKDGKAVDWEFMRIEQHGDTLVYLASPGGRPATPFPLASLDGTSAVFQSTLDFPRRVIYRKNPDGTLTARVEGTRDGRPAAREWTWRRLPKE